MISQAHSMIAETSCLNRNGATLALQGNASEASNYFRSAMQVLVNLTAGQHMMPSRNASFITPRNISSMGLEFPKEDSFCIYNSLLVFEPHASTATAGPQLEYDISYFSAAILFNLALIYHQRAANTGEFQFYRAADHMYLKGLVILQNFPEFADVDMTALQLSILNNQAHIRLKLGQTVETLGSASEEIRTISCVLLNFASPLPQLEADMINQILINTLVSGSQCAPSA